MTIYGEIKAIQKDERGYIAYIIEGLNPAECKVLGFSSLMCIQTPHWDTRELHIGDIGYVTFNKHKAGVDLWFNKDKFIPYKSSFTQFMSFIKPGKTLEKINIEPIDDEQYE